MVPGVAPTSARHRLRTGTGIGTDLPRRVFWPELPLLVLLRGSCLPELPAHNHPAFAASFQALLSVEVQDFLLQFSWPCIKELTAHIYGRRIVHGLSVISVDLVLILPALKSWQFAFSDPKNSSTMPHVIFKHCQRQNGPKALSTSTHSIPLVQSRSFNKI